MAFQDRELACRDCGGGFVFTAGEQEFYATKGLEHDPVRCPSCRANRKLMRPEDRDFAPAYGVYASWGGRTPRQLHVASCAQCASMTEVPFRPRDDRPVYCSDCYGDLRRKEEAQEAAEASSAAARITSSGERPPGLELFDLEPVAETLEGAEAAESTDAATEEPAVVAETATEEPAVAAETATEEPAVVAETATEEPAVVAETATEEPAVVAEAVTEEPAVVAEAATEEPAAVAETAPVTAE